MLTENFGLSQLVWFAWLGDDNVEEQATLVVHSDKDALTHTA